MEACTSACASLLVSGNTVALLMAGSTSLAPHHWFIIKLGLHRSCQMVLVLIPHQLMLLEI